MKYLIGEEEKEAVVWMEEAAKVARHALCLKAKCGTVIVKEGKVIGSGYNAPPLDDESNRTCLETYAGSDKPNFDTTCCMHAEWRAILDGLKNNPEKMKGSKLYFSRVGSDGDMKIKKAGKPYCTICSRLTLDTGVENFLLWDTEGICEYQTDEYNKLSYDYHKHNVNSI